MGLLYITYNSEVYNSKTEICRSSYLPKIIYVLSGIT